MLLRLIQTNLIYGYDNVAEKYIRLLEQTLAYADKASRYRQFLGHPEKMKADPELGGRYACVQHLSGLTNETQLIPKSGTDYPFEYFLASGFSVLWCYVPAEQGYEGDS